MGSTPRGISGSRGAAVLGLSQWKTPLAVWQEILEERCQGWNAAHGYVLPEPPDNAAIRWGLGFEDAICRLAEEHAGKRIMDRERFYELDFLTCHVDGLYEDGTLYEGKTTTLFSFHDDWGEPGSDRLPQSYQIQCQGNMALSGASSCIVSVLVWPRRPDEWEAAGIELVQALGRGDELECHVRRRDGTLTGEFVDHPETNAREFKTHAFATPCLHWARMLDELGYFHQYTIPASPTLQAELVSAYTEWWTEYVLGEKEPEPRNWDDIRRLVPAPKGTVVADETLERWCAEYADITSEVSASGRLGKRREELKVLILDTVRKLDPQIDDDSREATIIRDRQGKKLARYSAKSGFRT